MSCQRPKSSSCGELIFNINDESKLVNRSPEIRHESIFSPEDRPQFFREKSLSLPQLFAKISDDSNLNSRRNSPRIIMKSLLKQVLDKQHIAAPSPTDYRISGPPMKNSNETSQKLTYTGQLLHYQLNQEKFIKGQSVLVDSDESESDSEDSDDENNQSHCSVYECPGLAPTVDIEVENPMFENAVTEGNSDLVEK